MNDKNLSKLERAIQVFNDEGFYAEQFPNGQLQIDGYNYWSTSDKWYNPKEGKGGNGINELLSVLKRKVKQPEKVKSVSNQQSGMKITYSLDDPKAMEQAYGLFRSELDKAQIAGNFDVKYRNYGEDMRSMEIIIVEEGE